MSSTPVSASISKQHAQTPSGAHVGTTVPELPQIYGSDLERGVEPYDFYIEDDEDFYIEDGEKVLTFETDGETATKMGVHNYPARYLWDIREGC